jgi:hypothetical protein
MAGQSPFAPAQRKLGAYGLRSSIPYGISYTCFGSLPGWDGTGKEKRRRVKLGLSIQVWAEVASAYLEDH